MNKKKISVCIPTYNGEKYIKEQIDSILCQLGEDDEIIISDDRSTDRTIDILRSYNDSRIKIFIHQAVGNKYKGHYKTIYYVSKNVENAMKYAEGDIIFLSDQDDVWLPDKVEKVKSAFELGAEYIQHDITIVDQDLTVLLESRFSIGRPSHNILSFILRCRAGGSAMAFSKRIANVAIPFIDMPFAHDHWIACCTRSHNCRMTFIENRLMLYRRHNNTASTSFSKRTTSLWHQISYRLLTIYALIISLFRKL